MRISKGIGQPETIRLDHWLNMVEHTHDPNQVEPNNVMREARKCVQEASTPGRSEGEMRARMVSCHVFLVSFHLSI